VRHQGTLTLEACGSYWVHAFCGSLSVLEYRDDPHGRRINLKLALLPAKTTPVEPDPIFFLAGGPGTPATEQWLNAGTVFPGLNDHRDIVLIDQRGTGGSHRIEYPAFPVLTGLSAAEAAQAMQAWQTTALAGLEADPRYYTTAIAMDDVDEVRVALGYDRVNLYGNSYGATAAQVYLRRHESHVRAVVLDAGSLLDVNMVERFAPNAQHALDLVLARCEADPPCSATYPSARQQVTELIARLRQHPITIHHTDGSPDSVLTPWLAEAALQSQLVELTTRGRLPGSIKTVSDLVRSAEDNQVTAAVTLENTPAPDLMMRWSILCTEFWARQTVAGVSEYARGTLFDEWALDGAFQHEAVCAVVPPGIADPAEGSPVRSEVPVLLLNGEADPQDPPANVADAPQDLPNSLSVVVPGAAHTVGHLGCLPRVVLDFIERGSAEGLDTTCVKDFQPPSFNLDD
jgi:pimeloyl-ACP methyl ester carboxylesterase